MSARKVGNTSWAHAWNMVGQSRKSKRWLKKVNHRKNRAIAKKLDTTHVRLNSWDVW